GRGAEQHDAQQREMAVQKSAGDPEFSGWRHTNPLGFKGQRELQKVNPIEDGGRRKAPLQLMASTELVSVEPRFCTTAVFNRRTMKPGLNRCARHASGIV